MAKNNTVTEAPEGKGSAAEGASSVIISGWLRVAPESRDEIVRLHEDMVRRSRAAPGCLDLAISADPVDPARVNMYELWASEGELDAWRAQASSPMPKNAILGADVKKHYVSHSGPPF